MSNMALVVRVDIRHEPARCSDAKCLPCCVFIKYGVPKMCYARTPLMAWNTMILSVWYPTNWNQIVPYIARIRPESFV